MLFSYIKIAFRSLLKYRAYAIISVAGLAIAMACSALVLLYVADELRFDAFHKLKARIYRVGTDMVDIKTGAINGSIEANGWPVGRLLEQNYPEVEAVVYIRNAYNLMVNYDGRRFEERIYYAGKDFFRLFTFDLVRGNPDQALSGPNKVVISRSMAEKYFGGMDALGKNMTFSDTLMLEVSGVMEDVPSRSHMQFDMLVSFETYEKLNSEFTYDDGWGNLNVRNYILLKEGVDADLFVAKARNLYMDHVKKDLEKYGMYLYLGFEPLGQLYLHTSRGNGMGPVGSMERIYMVSGIGIFIVLLACINFINLSTARSAYRAKEVGLRKVVGSSRPALVWQFLTESGLTILFSFLLAIVLASLCLPMFNTLMGKSYTALDFLEFRNLLGYGSLVMLITFLAGYYPSMVLSAFSPSQVFKGGVQSGLRGGTLRRVLVVFQFAISTSLIMGTLVVNRQLSFMKGRDLGFSKDQILVINTSRLPSNVRVNPELFKYSLRQLPSVQDVTYSNAVPGRPGWVGQWAHAADKPADETIGVEYMSIDEEYLKTLGLTLIAGENFDIAKTSTLAEGLIINEKTVEKMGWETPENAIGKKITSPSGHPEGTVIGVVRDYHEFGLQQEIYPMTMDYAPENSRYFVIRYQSAGTEGLLGDIQKLWKRHYEGYAFDYFFLNENFERQYEAEKQLARVFMIFTGIAICIAIVGLVGMVSFMVNARTKEIGVRKILGANIKSLASLLSTEFVVMVLVANALALPVSWMVSRQWLEGFAYRAEVHWTLFLLTFLIAMGLTILTISVQTVKAAMADPVKSLRYE